ncbi:unnamed protein product [Prunus armeniaca]|uniref:Uncharacterized protein n=1 Tax=Prunus armeniaca TaxID=36596 RepID=A0A6J5Y4M4_PRUAR|nr:unnamed protein product [Prunus armeniaca]CAB4319482.1 unnamed protein product [Prunus armeniaca]
MQWPLQFLINPIIIKAIASAQGRKDAKKRGIIKSISVKGRLVRFVSTPAVMERFVSIEREILQIESSVQLEEGISVFLMAYA